MGICQRKRLGRRGSLPRVRSLLFREYGLQHCVPAWCQCVLFFECRNSRIDQGHRTPQPVQVQLLPHEPPATTLTTSVGSDFITLCACNNSYSHCFPTTAISRERTCKRPWPGTSPCKDTGQDHGIAEPPSSCPQFWPGSCARTMQPRQTDRGTPGSAMWSNPLG